MDRLYDLMRVYVKKQLLATASADELLQVVMNHMKNCRELMENDENEETAKLVSETIVVVAETFGELSAADWFLVKQVLCRFFQDVKSKSFTVEDSETTLLNHTATGGRIPGSVRYYDNDGCVDSDEPFRIASADNIVLGSSVPIMERTQCTTLLGLNEATNGAIAAGKSVKTIVANARRVVRGDASEHKMTRREFKVSPGRGLDLLAELVGASTKDGDDNPRPLLLNLFGESKDDEEETVPTVWIDARSESKDTDARFDDFFDAKDESKREQDDLLGLMDSMT